MKRIERPLIFIFRFQFFFKLQNNNTCQNLIGKMACVLLYKGYIYQGTQRLMVVDLIDLIRGQRGKLIQLLLNTKTR